MSIETSFTNAAPSPILAYAEMRMILARVIWKFDMTLAEESRNWIDTNEVYTLWKKPPLWVHLTPRKIF